MTLTGDLGLHEGRTTSQVHLGFPLQGEHISENLLI